MAARTKTCGPIPCGLILTHTHIALSGSFKMSGAGHAAREAALGARAETGAAPKERVKWDVLALGTGCLILTCVSVRSRAKRLHLGF